MCLLFIRETQKAINRVLTARAVQKLLLHLYNDSPPTYTWLVGFVKTVPPIDGDEVQIPYCKLLCQ